jgi:hypothetical protein
LPDHAKCFLTFRQRVVRDRHGHSDRARRALERWHATGFPHSISQRRMWRFCPAATGEKPGEQMSRPRYWVALPLIVGLLASRAHAQPGDHEVRLFVDTNVVSAGVVRATPSGGSTDRTTVIGVGPNNLGSSRAVLPAAPLGLGFAYVLRPKWLVGARTGFGFDRVESDAAGDRKDVTFSLMPELTMVPLGEQTKLFAKFSPVFEILRSKQGSSTQQIYMGCFSVGLGAFIFTAPTSSIDVGAYFEGRFGDLKLEPDGLGTDIDDLRGVLRLGISLWG